MEDAVVLSVPINFLVRLLEKKSFCSLLHYCIQRSLCKRKVIDVCSMQPCVCKRWARDPLFWFSAGDPSPNHRHEVLFHHCLFHTDSVIVSPVPHFGQKSINLWCDMLHLCPTTDMLICGKEDFLFSDRVKHILQADTLMEQFL